MVGSWRVEGGRTTRQRGRRPEAPGGGTREPGRGQPGGRQGRPGGLRDLRETGQWGGRQMGCPGLPGDKQPLRRPEEPESDKLGVPTPRDRRQSPSCHPPSGPAHPTGTSRACCPQLRPSWQHQPPLGASGCPLCWGAGCQLFLTLPTAVPPALGGKTWSRTQGRGAAGGPGKIECRG